eukprot:scaffold149593_cov25-Prasinocladus_malaysianus.AAC.2
MSALCICESPAGSHHAIPRVLVPNHQPCGLRNPAAKPFSPARGCSITRRALRVQAGPEYKETGRQYNAANVKIKRVLGEGAYGMVRPLLGRQHHTTDCDNNPCMPH